MFCNNKNTFFLFWTCVLSVVLSTHCVDTREVLSAEDQWKRYTHIVVSAPFHIQRTCKTKETWTWNKNRITYLYILSPLTAPYSSLSHPLSYSSFTSLPDAPTCISPSCWTSPTHVDESGSRNPQGRHRCCHWGIPPYLVRFTSYFLPWILTRATPFCILIHPSTYTLKPTHSFTYSLMYVDTPFPAYSHARTHTFHPLPPPPPHIHPINPPRMYSHISSPPPAHVDLQPDVRALVYSRLPNPLQRWNMPTSALQLLPCLHEGRQHWG